MKKFNQLTALAPKFIQNFKCTGSDCKDTCCAGWQIPVDKVTFHYYKNNKHPALKKSFVEHIKINPVGNKSNYGTIKLREDNNSCQFLNEGLCEIQKQLGPQALSDTCSTFPRITLQHGDLLQQGITPSCPEAAKLILIQNDFTEFVPLDVPIRKEQILNIKYNHDADLNVATRLRFFTLSILRHEEYVTWEKLAILGLMCQQINQLNEGEQVKEISNIIEEYEAAIDSGLLKTSLSRLVTQPEIQSKIFSGIIFPRIFHNNTKFQKETLEKFSQIVFHGQSNIISSEFTKLIEEKYTIGLTRLNQILANFNCQKFFDNYLVNQMYNEGFPFNGKSPLDAYRRLAANFGGLRLVLSLSCSDVAYSVDMDFLIDLTQIYVRKFEHDLHFKELISSAFDDSGFNDMKYIIGLIRD